MGKYMYNTRIIFDFYNLVGEFVLGIANKTGTEVKKQL